MTEPKMHVWHNCQSEVGGSLRFCDLTAAIIANMNDAQIADLTNALIGGFEYGGDPRCWEGFDECSEETQQILTMQYEIRMEIDPPDLGFGEHTPLH